MSVGRFGMGNIREWFTRADGQPYAKAVGLSDESVAQLRAIMGDRRADEVLADLIRERYEATVDRRNVQE